MKRIWELDALRGLGILSVIILHLLYDLSSPILLNPVVDAFRRGVGIFFVLLSGLCVTLGKKTLKRGLTVFFWAMVITAVTAIMAHWGFLPRTTVIRFGVLHLLGVCMLLWPLWKKLPTWALMAVAVVLVMLGHGVKHILVESPWLFPLGLRRGDFSSGDYFPLLPFLGWFLLGAGLGRTIYKEKQTRFPRVCEKGPVLAGLCWCGRNCLLLYLLHQPVLFFILNIIP